MQSKRMFRVVDDDMKIVPDIFGFFYNVGFYLQIWDSRKHRIPVNFQLGIFGSSIPHRVIFAFVKTSRRPWRYCCKILWSG